MIETESYIFLIMEFLEGGELYNLIVDKGKLDEK